MAACKSMLDAASNVPHSSMVTVMARNGVSFGIRLSGTGDRWFQAPANPVDGLFFPGFGVNDAAADLGDSAITETAGIGGFAMAASPAIVKFVGGTPADAVRHSQAMHEITLTTQPAFTLPALNLWAAAAALMRGALSIAIFCPLSIPESPISWQGRTNWRGHYHRTAGLLHCRADGSVARNDRV
jgi:hypothetical protein